MGWRKIGIVVKNIHTVLGLNHQWNSHISVGHSVFPNFCQKLIYSVRSHDDREVGRQ